MKIIHCINHFLPQHIAGTEMYVYALCKTMDKRTHEMLVVIPNYGFHSNDEYDFEGIRVIKYAEPSIVDRNLQMGKRKPDGLVAFIEVLRKEKADIIHFHELAGSSGITLHHVRAVKDLGGKVMMTFHLARYSCKTGTLMYKNETPCNGIINIKKCTLCNYKVNGLNDSLSPFVYSTAVLFQKLNVDASQWGSRIGTVIGYPLIIEKLKRDLLALVNYCDKVVVLSDWYYNVLLNNNIEAGKITLLKQAVFNYTKIQAQRSAASLPLKIIFVGRISHLKGIKILISAIKNINYEKILLDIYGDSGEENYIDECKQVSVGMKNISWKGRLPPNEVINTLSKYDILCLPSVVCEMSPFVIQEAFAAEVPVLATNVYGNSEQITHNSNGWLFKFNDVNDLTEKLTSLIEDPSLIDEARKRIPEVKRFEKLSKEYEILYSNICFEKPY